MTMKSFSSFMFIAFLLFSPAAFALQVKANSVLQESLHVSSPRTLSASSSNSADLHPQLLEVHQTVSRSLNNVLSDISSDLSEVSQWYDSVSATAPGILGHFALYQAITLLVRIYQQHKQTKGYIAWTNFVISEGQCQTSFMTYQTIFLLKAVAQMRKKLLQFAKFDDPEMCQQNFAQTCKNIHPLSMAARFVGPNLDSSFEEIDLSNLDNSDDETKTTVRGSTWFNLQAWKHTLEPFFSAATLPSNAPLDNSESSLISRSSSGEHKSSKSIAGETISSEGNSENLDIDFNDPLSVSQAFENLFQAVKENQKEIRKHDEQSSFSLENFKIVDKTIRESLADTAYFKTACESEPAAACSDIVRGIISMDKEIETLSRQLKVNVREYCSSSADAADDVQEIGRSRELAIMDTIRSHEWEFTLSQIRADAINEAESIHDSLTGISAFHSNADKSFSNPQSYASQSAIPSTYGRPGSQHYDTISYAFAEFVYYLESAMNYIAPEVFDVKVKERFSEALHEVCSDGSVKLKLIAEIQKLFTAQEQFVYLLEHFPSFKHLEFSPNLHSLINEIYMRYNGDDSFASAGYHTYCEQYTRDDERISGSRDLTVLKTCRDAVQISLILMDPDMPEYERSSVLKFSKHGPLNYLHASMRLFKIKATKYSNAITTDLQSIGCEQLQYIEQVKFERTMIFSQSTPSSRNIPAVSANEADYLTYVPECKIETIAYCVAAVQKELCSKNTDKLGDIVKSVFTKYAEFYPPESRIFKFNPQQMASSLGENAANVANRVEQDLKTLDENFGDTIVRNAISNFLNAPVDVKAPVRSYFKGVLTPIARECGEFIRNSDTSNLEKESLLKCDYPVEASKYFGNLQYEMAFGKLKWYSHLVYGDAGESKDSKIPSASCTSDWRHDLEWKDGYTLLSSLFPTASSSVDSSRIASSNDLHNYIVYRQRYCDATFTLQSRKEFCNQVADSSLLDPSDVHFCLDVHSKIWSIDSLAHHLSTCLESFNGLLPEAAENTLWSGRRTRYCMSSAQVNDGLRDRCRSKVEALSNSPNDEAFCVLVSLSLFNTYQGSPVDSCMLYMHSLAATQEVTGDIRSLISDTSAQAPSHQGIETSRMKPRMQFCQGVHSFQSECRALALSNVRLDSDEYFCVHYCYMISPFCYPEFIHTNKECVSSCMNRLGWSSYSTLVSPCDSDATRTNYELLKESMRNPDIVQAISFQYVADNPPQVPTPLPVQAGTGILYDPLEIDSNV